MPRTLPEQGKHRPEPTHLLYQHSPGPTAASSWCTAAGGVSYAWAGSLPHSAALAGRGLFVQMVGPNATVLRASLMGAVAVRPAGRARA